jgi:hypothetical protein
MKFSDLDYAAQSKAVRDYVDGWKETHPEEQMTFPEAFKLCMDINDDIEYNEKGEAEE